MINRVSFGSALCWTEYQRVYLGVASIAGLMLLWELLTSQKLLNPFLVSSPSGVFAAASTTLLDTRIWSDVVVTLRDFAAGLALATVVGISLGIALGWFRRLGYLADPLVSAMYNTPRIALFPLIIIWLGLGLYSKIAVVFLGAVFPLLVNTMTGLRTAEVSHLNMARSFGANQRQVLRTVVLPGAVPYIVAGFRLGSGRAFMSVIAAEFFLSSEGLGVFLAKSALFFQTSRFLLGILVVAVFGIALGELTTRVQRRVETWRPERG